MGQIKKEVQVMIRTGLKYASGRFNFDERRSINRCVRKYTLYSAQGALRE